MLRKRQAAGRIVGYKWTTDIMSSRYYRVFVVKDAYISKTELRSAVIFRTKRALYFRGSTPRDEWSECENYTICLGLDDYIDNVKQRTFSVEYSKFKDNYPVIPKADCLYAEKIGVNISEPNFEPIDMTDLDLDRAGLTKDDCLVSYEQAIGPKRRCRSRGRHRKNVHNYQYITQSKSK